MANEENWFEVNFVDFAITTFSAQITISPSSEFLFNVYTEACTNTALACGNEGNNSTGLASWAMSQTDTLTATPSPPPVGTNGIVYVEVYRPSGAVTCDSYTLTITD